MRRPIGHRTSTATDLPTILSNQTDPAYMAAVARQRALVQEGKVWRYHRSRGEWYLRPLVDGSAKPEYDIIVHANTEPPQEYALIRATDSAA